MKLYKFYADWCGPCKMLKPVLAQLAKDAPDITVVEVNADLNIELVAKYEVTALPTVVIIDESTNEVVQKIVGLQPMKSYKEALGL